MEFLGIFFIIAFCYNLFHREFGIFKSIFNAALWTIALVIVMFALIFAMAGGFYILALMAH